MMRGLSDIRSTFLEYFVKEGHAHVSSSSLVPHNDPTLLFTAAGMVQFKDIFTGLEKPAWPRTVTAQKCLRAGGKHNDLENVGYTTRHHTFFEMLGNFSFGDYFKEQAIYFAWTLLTKIFALDPKHLLITVYADDTETASLWKKISNFSDEKIIRIATADNFWSMGDTGPCGPCSEIFFDHGEKIPGGPPGSSAAEGERFTEIWNLVFMEYEQKADDSRISLPKPSIDTGMGLERMAAVLQGVHDNYETDLFQTLIKTSQELTHNTTSQALRSHRVIADHLRASAFLIADGILPSNEGRGYVLRRIMRRAMRHAHLLGAQEPLLWKLVPTLIQLMGTAYSELVRAETLIREILEREEEKFRLTLERGLRLLNEATATLSSGQSLPGIVAFKLYDTYGFPLDLTQDALKSSGRSVDVTGFNAAMEAQRQTARTSWMGSGEHKNEQLWYDLYEQFGATEFLGYEATQAEGLILALLKEQQVVEEVHAGDTCQVIVNQTPFYAESGGQMGDTGEILASSGVELEVRDTLKKVGNLHVHMAKVRSGTLKHQTPVKLIIDHERRRRLRANHSVTHLLHAALRYHLGTQVTQKGSLVAPDRLRFDFSYGRPLTRTEIEKIEALVNQSIQRNSPTMTRLMSPQEATSQGAVALFGERYGTEVRVVSMGKEIDSLFSVELCGGTHVEHTGDIGFFKITAESGIAAGIRRIEAVTGLEALKYVKDMDGMLAELSELLKATPKELVQRVKTLIQERKTLEAQMGELRKQLALKGKKASSVESEPTETIGDHQILISDYGDLPEKNLKSLVDSFKKQLQSGIIILTSKSESKVALVVGVTEDITSKISAIDLVHVGAKVLGGKGGGGRADLAQTGGPLVRRLPQAITAIKDELKRILTERIGDG